MLPATGRQHRGFIIPQAVTHSLVFLKTGKIIARNMLSWLELIGIISKPLLLHLVGCIYYLYQWCTVKQISNNEIYLLIKYIKSVLWRLAKRLSYIEDARCLEVKENSALFGVCVRRYGLHHVQSCSFHHTCFVNPGVLVWNRNNLTTLLSLRNSYFNGSSTRWKIPDMLI